MNKIKKLTVYTALAVMLFGMSGCTIIGIGVGAVAGSGTSVGALGGAAIGGVIGYNM